MMPRRKRADDEGPHASRRPIARWQADIAEARALLASSGKTVSALACDPATPAGARRALVIANRNGWTTL